MEKFTVYTGKSVPLMNDNIDTEIMKNNYFEKYDEINRCILKKQHNFKKTVFS